MPGTVPAQTARRPVVVELFTSQGCSSCPPADALVAELARTRSDLLPLTFHVTYWNTLGWQDPFSFAGATERQRRYVALAISPEVYTPAMVVDGRRDVVGSDGPAVAASLAQAAADLRTGVPVNVVPAAGGVGIEVGTGRGHGQVLLIGYDRQHDTHVGRGENGGRTLREANVVRSVSIAGEWTGASLHVDARLPAGEAFAVIVQGDDGAIIGAARLAMPPS